MSSSLPQNSRFLGHAESLRRAVLRLSAEGFLVIRAVADEEIFVEIDRPLHGVDVKNFKRGEKTFGGCERFDCKIFWALGSGQ